MEIVSREDKGLLVFVSLFAVYVLNDFLFLASLSAEKWLFFDYSIRTVSLAVAFFFIRKGVFAPSELGLRPMAFKKMAFWTGIIFLLGVVIDRFLWRFLTDALPGTALFSFPPVENRFLYFFDLSFGIALVALSEEIIFRGIAYSVLKKHIARPVAICFVSGIMFGLIHWSLGIPSLITTFLWGFCVMAVFIKTKNIWPAILGHYLYDLLDFSGWTFGY